MTRRSVLTLLPAAKLSAQVLKMGETSEGYVALFNGRDMGRWETDNEESWTIGRGTLQAKSDGKTEQRLVLEGSEFGDFELRFELRVHRGAARFRLRWPGQGPWSAELEQTTEQANWCVNGGFFSPLFTARAKQWTEYRIIAKGPSFNIFQAETSAPYHFQVPDLPKNGKLALVIPTGPPAEAEFRSIRLK